MSESPKIKKSTAVLTNEHYNTPNTSLLTFQFEPYPFASADLRIRNCSIKQASIDGKDIYILDDLFQEQEGNEMRDFTKKATFSRNSYGSPEAIDKGEKPARSMNGKERWHLFNHSSQAIKEIYKILGVLSVRLDAEITTLPWELCDFSSHGSPSVLGNFLEEASFESMELGKHQDCNPKKGIPFGIPVLYSDKKEFHPNNFENGDPGHPWLVSLMLYVTDEGFLPEYWMGTTFYNNDGVMLLRTNCINMRLVLFEGDILHSIEESKIPREMKTWRASYVYKLIINPRQKDQNLKKIFSELFSAVMEKIELVSPKRV